ncbi:MAG: hypothetical protein JWM14_2278 [Chitinophagaceae bacterium]|nr:hypothetical protein [Chitinophagaceae bacterium]
MKKIILVLSLLLLFFNYSTSFAQSETAFKRNNFIINGGFGVGFGYSYQNYTVNNFYSYGNDYSLDFRVHYSVAGIFPVTAEYAISNKFGLGVAYQHGSYVNSYSNKSTNNNFGIFGAFHFARREKIELYTRLIVGYSQLSYTEGEDESQGYDATDSYVPNTNNSFTFKPTGGYAKPSFGMRLYFTKHLGMFADFGIGVYSYNTSQVETDKGTYDINKRFHYVLFNGELTAGLAVKF